MNPDKFIKKMQEKNVKVITWPLSKKRELKKFFRKGVDMVMTGEEELFRQI